MSKRDLVRLNRDAILEAALSLGAERIRLFGSPSRGAKMMGKATWISS